MTPSCPLRVGSQTWGRRGLITVGVAAVSALPASSFCFCLGDCVTTAAGQPDPSGDPGPAERKGRWVVTRVSWQRSGCGDLLLEPHVQRLGHRISTSKREAGTQHLVN